MKTFKLFFVLVVSVLFFSGCANNSQLTDKPETVSSIEQVQVKSNFVSIKYRDSAVDIAANYFESLNTSNSSFINGAWYDGGNQYLVLNLRGIYYHYCGLPQSTWGSFKAASSFGTYYNAHIKGNYDCRLNPAPNY